MVKKDFIMNRYFLVGIFAIILAGCSSMNNQTSVSNTGTFIANGKSVPCTITGSYKTPACYITTSQSGNIVITNQKPDCKNAVCVMPACSTIISYLPSGKVVRKVTPCAS